MSVHEEPQPDGTVIYQVRWRHQGRNRARRFNPRKLGGQLAARNLAHTFNARLHALDPTTRAAARATPSRRGS